MTSCYVIDPTKGEGAAVLQPPNPSFQGVIFKKAIDTMISRVLLYLSFSLNQPLKAADN